MKPSSLRGLLRKLHNDEEGAVASIDTILIIAAIAIPVLIFLWRFGWPLIKQYFLSGIQELQGEADKVKYGQ